MGLLDLAVGVVVLAYLVTNTIIAITKQLKRDRKDEQSNRIPTKPDDHDH
jgi:hypothetical protein